MIRLLRSAKMFSCYKIAEELFERLLQDDLEHRINGHPFCSGVPLLLNNAVRLFERLPQDDLERRINGGLRPPVFEKGIEQNC